MRTIEHISKIEALLNVVINQVSDANQKGTVRDYHAVAATAFLGGYVAVLGAFRCDLLQEFKGSIDRLRADFARERQEQDEKDRLFIQEVINKSMRRDCYFLSTPAGEMLRDWAAELKQKTPRLRGRVKYELYSMVGRGNWA